MGAKYLPTIKDLKANQRFQQKQSASLKPNKPAEVRAAKNAKKK